MFTLRQYSNAACPIPAARLGRVLEAEALFGGGLKFRESLKGRLVRFSPKAVMYVAIVFCLCTCV